MKIFHVHCLHGGEWESYWPQARRELARHGRIVNHFPEHHNGAWIWTEVLRELGHEVVEFDYLASYLLSKEAQVRAPWSYQTYKWLTRTLPALHRSDVRLMNQRLLEVARAEQPDLFITYPGEMIYPQTIRKLQRQLGVRTVLWLGRDPVVEGTPNVVESFPYYDHVFTIDPPNVEKFKQHGAAWVAYLPLGCYQRIHRTMELSDEDRRLYQAPVSFVGNLFDDRPELLAEIVDLEVNFWSHSWNRQMQRAYPQLAPYYRGPARGLRMLKVLNGADIVINVHRAYNSVAGTNMRTFEAAGCRCFQIVEYKPEIARMFKIGEEIEVYYDIPDLKQKVAYYLTHPDERQQMAAAAQSKVYAEHTYQQRFSEMIQAIKSA